MNLNLNKKAAALGLLCPALGLSLFAADANLQTLIKNAKQAPVKIDAPTAKLSAITPLAQKEWTVMVYINGKNSLEGAALYNINTMEIIGSNDKLNIVVEAGRMNGQKDGDVHDEGDWTGVRRYYIQSDFTPASNNQADVQKAYEEAMKGIHSPVLENFPIRDMGDYKNAIDFVKWAKTNFPAKKYLLILWNHGSGWLDPAKKQPAAQTTNKGVSFDDETGNYFTVPEVGKIVKEAGGVDVLTYDACLMQMAETAFETKNDTQFMVGSEEVVPGMGMNYLDFLSTLADNPGLTPEQLSGVLVDTFGDMYQKMYDKQKAGVTFSAIRSSAVDGFLAKLKAWSEVAIRVNDKAAYAEAEKNALRFDLLGVDTDPVREYAFSTDLYHYIQLVNENTQNDELKQAGTDLMDYIASTLVVKNTGVGRANDNPKVALGLVLKYGLGKKPLDRFNYQDNAHGIAIVTLPATAQPKDDKINGFVRNVLKAYYSGYYTMATETKWSDFVRSQDPAEQN